MASFQKCYSWRNFLSSLEGDRILAGIGGTLLLCTPLVGDPGIANGLVMGKIFWFHLAMLLMAASAGWGMWKEQIKIRFRVADGLVIAFALITLLTYDWQLNPEPEKLFFGGQLFVLWFFLRQRLEGDPELCFYFLLVLLIVGAVEAIWGIRQLQGETVSNHALFRLTGSFYNPGPYSGFLAMILPIGLWIACRFKKLASYIGWICVGLILIVLPAGMSRTAWIAAAIACGWVYWETRVSWKRQDALYIMYKKHAILYTLGALLLAAGIAIALYGMKRESAEGRLLLWKVTAQAIAKQPLTGTGVGGFPAAFAEAQAQYFSSGKATDTLWHFRLNHNPEYLFQEAQCLSKEHREGEAITVLKRAKQLSADPMIRYMLAKNLQQLGKYPEAEQELLHAIDIVPERIYPYYLLAKLYAEPAFYQPQKLREAAEVVLYRKAKVETSALREMRNKIKAIYLQHE